MKTRWTFATLFVAVLLALPSVLAQEEEKDTEKKDEVNLEEVKCPLSGRAVDAERTIEHQGATVYFCCPNCMAAFKKDPKNERFAAKVNYQIVATKQAKQKACPMSGMKTKEGTEVEVGYATVPVAFCCANCQKKAKDTTDEDKLIALIFGDQEKFAKAFQIGEEEEEKDGEG